MSIQSSHLIPKLGQESSSTSTDLVELKNLEKEACLCKTATKIAGCICLPVSWLCYVGFHIGCFVLLESRDIHPTKRIYYSTWTTCQGGRCWLPKRPPQDLCDQFWQILDPFVCCLCCDKGNSAHYLPPEKQKMWVNLKKKYKTSEMSDDELEPPVEHYSPPPSSPRFHIGPQGSSGWH